MTYKEIQSAYKSKYGKTVKTCWIADIKRKHGATNRAAHNRISDDPKYPCPSNIEPQLTELMTLHGVI